MRLLRRRDEMVHDVVHDEGEEVVDERGEDGGGAPAGTGTVAVGGAAGEPSEAAAVAGAAA